MKIVVCIKQIPDTSDIQWSQNNTMLRDGVESIINPYDLYALEEALRIENSHISVFTMGPNQAKNALKEAIAMGADEGILVCDRKFAGSDTNATSKILTNAITKKSSDFDLIFCGQFALDGDTAQTGASIAARLNIAHLSFVREIVKIENNEITLKREVEDGIETVKASLPVLLSIIKNEHAPRTPKISGWIKAQRAQIQELSCQELNIKTDEIGVMGSPTRVVKSFRNVSKRKPYIVNYKENREILDNLHCIIKNISRGPR